MKRILIGSILLVIGINSSVFAKTYDLSQISQVKLVSEYPTDTTVDEMDTVTFGSYPQSDTSGNTKEPIEWIVLEKLNDGNILLFSKNIIDEYCYHDKNEHVTYKNSAIRKWLNTDFYDYAFNDSEKLYMADVYEDNDKVDLLDVYDGIKFGLFTKNKNKTQTGDEFRFVNNIGATDYTAYLISKLPFGPPLTTRQYYIKGETTYGVNGTLDGSTEIFIDRPVWLTNGGNKIIGGLGVRVYAGIRPIISISTKALNGKSNTKSILGDNVNIEGINVWQNQDGTIQIGGTQEAGAKLIQSGSSNDGRIAGLPSRESELRSDDHFYLDDSMQRNTWVYYKTYYYHVDGSGNIQKNQWIELRYVGEDGRMYRGRQTPDGKWVGDDGLVVDAGADLSKSLTIEAAEPDSWYKTQSGLWYYFENDRTTTKKGWFTDKRDNQTYYLDPQTGIMAVGWTTINGSEYYFNESHNNEVNWYETCGGFYESYNKKVKAYGSMYKNETTPDGKKVGADGKLITNEMEQQTSLNINRNNEISSGKDNRVIPNENFTGLKDGYYYLNGVKLVNKWVEIEGNGYYFDSAGKNYKFNP